MPTVDTKKLLYKELNYDGEAHLLDAMQILLVIWKGDNKYARDGSIVRCSRRADILSVSWNADINNDVGFFRQQSKRNNLQKKTATYFVTYSLVFN